jgi:hypothetical protein
MSSNRKVVPAAQPKDSGEVKAQFSLEELVGYVEEHTGEQKMPQKEGEISARQLADSQGCSLDAARKKLGKMVTDGKMECRWASGNEFTKAPYIVYWKKEGR